MSEFNFKNYLREGKLVKENQYTYINDDVLDMDYNKIRAYISTKKGDEFADDFIDGYNDNFYENVVRFFNQTPNPTDEEVLNFVDIEIRKKREKYIPAPNAPGGRGLKEDNNFGNNLRFSLKRGNEYSVLEPGMNEYLDDLEFIGYDMNDREYIFMDSTNIAPSSNDVFFLKVPDSEIEAALGRGDEELEEGSRHYPGAPIDDEPDEELYNIPSQQTPSTSDKLDIENEFEDVDGKMRRFRDYEENNQRVLRNMREGKKKSKLDKALEAASTKLAEGKKKIEESDPYPKTREEIIKLLVKDFGKDARSYNNTSTNKQREKRWTYNKLKNYLGDLNKEKNKLAEGKKKKNLKNSQKKSS